MIETFISRLGALILAVSIGMRKTILGCCYHRMIGHLHLALILHVVLGLLQRLLVFPLLTLVLLPLVAVVEVAGGGGALGTPVSLRIYLPCKK